MFLQKTLSGSFTVRNRHLQQLLEAEGHGHRRRVVLHHPATGQRAAPRLPHRAGEGVYKTAFELDQRWIIEHAADRTPFICQSQSVNVFLPANVHKRDLHEIHMLAWKRGVKSLYYCRSLSIQRAEGVSDMPASSLIDIGSVTVTDPAPLVAAQAPATNYEECLACQ